MFFKLSKSLKVDRVLLITLSNIGDVVLTFPVLDALREAFPGAALDVVVGVKAAALFKGNPHVNRVIAFDKKMPFGVWLGWLEDLRREHFYLVVDLRNSAIPFLLKATTVTRPVFARAKTHMKEKHLARLYQVLELLPGPVPRRSVFISPEIKQTAVSLLKGVGRYVLVVPGAADRRKCWYPEGFSRVVRHLHARGQQVVLVGDGQDALAAQKIMKECPEGVMDLCGRTSLLELAAVIDGAALALTNDSGIMHLASYLDKPVVALFGPTDPFFYGPWSSKSVALRKGVSVDEITADEVILAVDKFL